MSPDPTKISDIVPLDLLRRFLMAHGWRLRDLAHQSSAALNIQASAEAQAFFRSRSTGKRNADVFVLSEPGQSDVELVIPRDHTSLDFDRRLQGAITTLSQLRGEEQDKIVAEVRSIGFDVVQSRIPNSLVADDTIRLESAKNFINWMKELLATTATTEIRPLAFFGRLNKDAVAYSDRCRFGHTYRGSFGFTIESPVTPNTGETLFGADSPRRSSAALSNAWRRAFARSARR